MKAEYHVAKGPSLTRWQRWKCMLWSSVMTILGAESHRSRSPYGCKRCGKSWGLHGPMDECPKEER